MDLGTRDGGELSQAVGELSSKVGRAVFFSALVGRVYLHSVRSTVQYFFNGKFITNI